MILAQVSETVQDTRTFAELAAVLVGLAITVWGATGGRKWWQARRAREQFWRVFMADWLGEEPRPGVPARPGVMESLLQIRTAGAAMSERLRKAEIELLQLRSQMSVMHNRMSAVEKSTHLEGELG